VFWLDSVQDNETNTLAAAKEAPTDPDLPDTHKNYVKKAGNWHVEKVVEAELIDVIDKIVKSFIKNRPKHFEKRAEYLFCRFHNKVTDGSVVHGSGAQLIASVFFNTLFKSYCHPVCRQSHSSCLS